MEPQEVTDDFQQVPFNIQAEQAVLGALLSEASIKGLARIPFLKPEHFYEPVHQRIFESIEKLTYQDGQNASPIILKQKFDADGDMKDLGGAAYLAQIAGLASGIISVKDHAKIVFDDAQKRRIIDLSDKISKRAYDPNDNANEILGELYKQCIGIGKDTTKEDIISSDKLTLQIAEELQAGEMAECYPTGMPLIDNAMQGGIYGRKTYCFAAPDKNCKTMLCSTISHNLNLAGVKHMFIAAEMGKVEIHQRNMARGLGHNDILFRQARENKDFVKRVCDYSVQGKDPGNILYKDAPGITLDELKQTLAIAVVKYEIKGFFLDYIQLVQGKERNQSEASHISEVAQWMADFCRKENIWAAYTAQKNREDQILGSGGIDRAADQVWHMKRDDDGGVYLDLRTTRYTPRCTIGTDIPKLKIDNKGPYIRQIEDYEEVDF